MITHPSVSAEPITGQIWLRLWLPGPRPPQVHRRAPHSVADGECCGLTAVSISNAHPEYQYPDGEDLTHEFVHRPYPHYPLNGFDFDGDPTACRHTTAWAAYRPLRWNPSVTMDTHFNLSRIMQYPRVLLRPDHYVPLALPASLA